MENEILQQILSKLDNLEEGQKQTNQRFDKIEKRIDAIENKIDAIENKIDAIENKIDAIQEDIAEIKENAEVTRVTTNVIGAWAERVGEYVKIPVMVEGE